MDKLKKQMKDKMFFEKAVLFGGTGFIGTHFARYLLDNGLSEQVLLADIKPPSINLWPAPYQEYLKNGQIRYLEVDVRNFIEHPDLPAHADLVVNLAAVHREPGHEAYEYFGTNLPGAENVCEWAEKVGCSRIIFVSSIAPYGPSEEEKYENSLPVPLTPYGSSKLAAEKINIGWQRSVVDRKLIIVRPGVVFGPGEGGNVTRLIRAVLGRYFFYMGNRETRKAGGYVRELCHSLHWAMEKLEAQKKGAIMFNFTMDPAPSIEEYVNAICRVAGVRRFIPSVPAAFLLCISYFIDIFTRPLNINHPFSPVRVRKLIRSNNIVPGFIRENSYQYKYTLDQALEDWKRERPEDWE